MESSFSVFRAEKYVLIDFARDVKRVYKYQPMEFLTLTLNEASSGISSPLKDSERSKFCGKVDLKSPNSLLRNLFRAAAS
jgi:hypothetical protein